MDIQRDILFSRGSSENSYGKCMTKLDHFLLRDSFSPEFLQVPRLPRIRCGLGIPRSLDDTFLRIPSSSCSSFSSLWPRCPVVRFSAPSAQSSMGCACVHASRRMRSWRSRAATPLPRWRPSFANPFFLPSYLSWFPFNCPIDY